MPLNMKKGIKQRKQGKGASGKWPLTSSSGSSAANATLSEAWMPLFPKKAYFHTRYFGTFSLTTTLGAVNTYVIRASDLYDPDYTGSGHQPMGFDQVMSSYNHFAVLRARLNLTVSNTTNTTPVTVCIRQDANLTPLTVIEQIMEFGGLVTTRIDAFSNESARLTLEADFASLQGLSPSVYLADPSVRGTSAASPTENTYFHIAVWDTQATTSIVRVDWVLEQYSAFLEPRDLSISLTRAKPDGEEKEFVNVCQCAGKG